MCPGWLRHRAIKIELVETGRKKHFPLVFQLFPHFPPPRPHHQLTSFPFTTFKTLESLPFPLQKKKTPPNFLKAPKCSLSKKVIWKTQKDILPAKLDRFRAQNAAVQKGPFFNNNKNSRNFNQLYQQMVEQSMWAWKQEWHTQPASLGASLELIFLHIRFGDAES